MYERLFLLATVPDAPLSILRDLLADLPLGGNNEPPVFQQSATRLTVAYGDFHFRIDYQAGALVAEESREMAIRHAATHPARNRIQAAHSRYELSADADPDMDHFNDFLFISERIADLGEVHVFDPQTGGFE